MWHKKVPTWLTIISVGVATAFITFIMVMYEGLEKGAVNGYGPYELVIGAEGSASQLMLNTFYHIGSPTGNIAYEKWETIRASGLAENAYPITRGDQYKGYPLIGTPIGYLITRYPDAALTGELYKEHGEVVIGAHVADQGGLKIGDTFQASHGMVEEDVHEDQLYQVIGILPSLGTPDDKAIFTTLEYAWLAHAEHDESESSSHIEPLQGDITAIVVQPKGLMELQQIQQKFDEMEGVQAAYSSKTISELLRFLDTGSALVSLMAVACVIIAGITILLALSTVVAYRRKDISLLRLLGKSKTFILSSMVIEGVLLTLLGCVCGIIGGHVVSFLLSGTIFNITGISIEPWNFYYAELLLVVGGMLMGAIAAVIPSVQAYRVHPLLLFHS